ncbi:unnamed protein product [Dovyalis caffra]|uniref:Uncharacterized protein n=1 Tax=Dovyalis caffra TaxID=77055 RepID=A0AAV1RSL3_9ROSI|nr:unnamed protein product [Dovyalis caffra]
MELMVKTELVSCHVKYTWNLWCEVYTGGAGATPTIQAWGGDYRQILVETGSKLAVDLLDSHVKHLYIHRRN